MEWISVEDKMPKDGAKCFLLWDIKKRHEPHITYGYRKNGKWYDFNNDGIPTDIIAINFDMNIRYWLYMPDLPNIDYKKF